MRRDPGGPRAVAPWGVEMELGEADQGKVAKEQTVLFPPPTPECEVAPFICVGWPSAALCSSVLR